MRPHLLDKGVGTPIENRNAIEEVEKYLQRREKKDEQDKISAKKKILVVDDSQTLRQYMKQMLEKDYDVSMAASGVAAIRAVTLNRPDLILLDYEMPVCDGRQTLEMLRFEEEFKDIPVIFLTGRVDKESILKVKPLNPTGYLLKTLNPVEIKKNIDAYFEKQK